MADIWSKEKRSYVMSRIRGKNTKPEILLRSFLFNSGFRFRLHSKHLPGKPDIILAKYKTVIFVHGCFWHYHKKCPEGRIPNTNSKFWSEKLSKNIERDIKNQTLLKALGWNVIVVWECDIEKRIEEIGNELIKNIVSRP
ncbi:MAG TPA: DNA mismatch endonuclease Vsr [Mucilaginibacter sp.]